MNRSFDIVILGLTVTSSWGNGHATTYRSLIQGLVGRGYRVLFLERDAPWYAANRDEPNPSGAATEIYDSFDQLVTQFEREVAQATLVMVGSYVPDGVRCGEWVTLVAKGKTAFYDIDTPVTLAKLAAGERDYITPALIRRYGAYLSFTGGPILRIIESRYDAPMARALYCSVDPGRYYPLPAETRFDLGYMGTYSADRQPRLDALLLGPARQWNEGRFAVAGPQYPGNIQWPPNVQRTIHLSPREHASFYGAQKFSLNVTREAMRRAGYSPSVRLFEAAACGVPVISDWWQGLDSIFRIGKEALVAENTETVLKILRDMSDTERLAIGRAARRRVLAEHTHEQRALELENYLKEMYDDLSPDTTRRDGRRRKVFGGLEGGVLVKREGEGAGSTVDKEAVAIADPRCLHQPSGTSN
jgi:spore maturation protein CgeB